MKAFMGALVLVAGFGLTSAHAGVNNVTQEYAVASDDVSLPAGFAANTDAYVVVNGTFRNGCISFGRADVSSPTPMIHEVHLYREVAQGGVCSMMVRLYEKEISLGHLEHGNHTVRFETGDGKFFEKTLKVE